MSMIFNPPGNGGAESKNPFVFVEKCSLQLHIFSYRMVDFPSLFNFLNHYLNKGKDNKLNNNTNDKTPRYKDQLNDIFGDQKVGNMQSTIK